MPINSLDDASNFSVEKSLVNFAVANEVLQELNQSNKTIFTSCDKVTDIGNAVWDKDVQSLVPDFPDINVGCDILRERHGFATISC